MPPRLRCLHLGQLWSSRAIGIGTAAFAEAGLLNHLARLLLTVFFEDPPAVVADAPFGGIVVDEAELGDNRFGKTAVLSMVFCAAIKDVISFFWAWAHMTRMALPLFSTMASVSALASKR